MRERVRLHGLFPLGGREAMADLRWQLIARFAIDDKAPARLDAGGLLEALLLFDRVIVRSRGLRELVPLTRLLGVDALVELLRANHLAFAYSYFTIADAGRLSGPATYRGTRGPAPPGTYFFTLVYPTDRMPSPWDFEAVVTASRDRMVDRSIASVFAALSQLTRRQRRTLEAALRARLCYHAPGTAQEILEHFRDDVLHDRGSLQHALLFALQQAGYSAINPHTLRIEAEPLDTQELRLQTNLADLAALTPEAIHAIGLQACFALANRSVAIADMKAFHALAGFRDAEIGLFPDKLAFLADSLGVDWTQSVRTLHRVLEIRGLPRLEEAVQNGTFDPKRFVTAIQQPSCYEFRRWLRDQSPDMTPQELEAAGRSLRERFGGFLKTRWGKAARFLLGVGLGAIPNSDVAMAVSAGYSALDAFVIEHLFPSHGPVVFLTRHLPWIVHGPGGSIHR